MKKTLLLSLFLIFMLACVITPPEGMFSPTPTICVECVQATICAENVGDEECPVNSSATPAGTLPTLISGTQEKTPTDAITEEVLTTETIEALISITPEINPTKTIAAASTLTATATLTRTSTSTKTVVPSSHWKTSLIDHGKKYLLFLSQADS